ncbi:hypothetical protein LE192_004138, partial [Escherichia coli]|nr:hypothetical protein [Escherichia coli]
QITDKEKSKFVDFYMKITKASKTKPNIDNMADLLDFFVSMTKSYFASAISYYHYNKKVAGKSNKND